MASGRTGRQTIHGKSEGHALCTATILLVDMCTGVYLHHWTLAPLEKKRCRVCEGGLGLVHPTSSWKRQTRHFAAAGRAHLASMHVHAISCVRVGNPFFLLTIAPFSLVRLRLLFLFLGSHFY